MKTKSRELLAVGIFGRPSRLGERIETLLRRGREFSPRASLTRVALSGVALVGFVIAGALAPRWIAFAQDAARPEFEVASVRPSKAGDAGAFKSKAGKGGGLRTAIGRGRFNYTDSLYGLILRAYGIQGCRPFVIRDGDCALLSGGPAWLKRNRFDIQAKTPDGAPDYTYFQFLEGQAPRLQLMLQALLADRFNLKVHREMKQTPVYALTIAKKGPKLKNAEEPKTIQLKDASFVQNRGVQFSPSVQPNGERNIRLTARDSSMQALADTLSTILDR